MRALGVVMVLAATAHADVNLLKTVPTTIAVSSTVDNAAILPAQLVDGKLDTAWNSRTDELVGAWIAVRVPKGAHVTGFKLTAGFTHRQGNQDWFLWNARIKKLRISHDTSSIDVSLDPNNRELQAIPFTGDAGDYKLEVLEIVPGARATWREIAVSEFEVWGDVDGKPRGGVKPTVVVGSLDAPPVSEAQCLKAMYPDAKNHKLANGDRITAVHVVGLSKAYVACRVDHIPDQSIETTSDIAAMTVAGQLAGAPISEVRINGPYQQFEIGGDGPMVQRSDAVEANPLAVSPSESVLIVANTNEAQGMGGGGYETKSTLYRATPGGLVAVYTFTSKDSVGEEETGNECDLAIGRARAPFADLVLGCTEISTDWHNDDTTKRGRFTTPHTTKLHWNGTAYVE
jgi:hypothetical protein